MDYLKLLQKSITPLHATEQMAMLLEEAGFSKLNLADSWVLTGKHYIIRGGAIIAFSVPKTIEAIKVCVAHSDSPCLKLKPNCVGSTQNKYYKLALDPYGGLIYSSWLDRILSVAGKVYYEDNGIKEALFKIDKGLAIIPNMSIHQNREVNTGYKFNAQVDLQALFSLEEASLYTLIEEQNNLKPNSILSVDGYMYVVDRGGVFGYHDEFIASPALDDLACSYSTLAGFLASKGDSLALWASFNDEEVGSLSPEGASSPLLKDIIERILSLQKVEIDKQKALMSNIKIISADNAHALHPNFPEKSDALNNCVLNCGVVIKHHAGRRYATTAYMDAYLKDLCKKHNIPNQVFANRNDAVSGATIGSLISGVLVGEIADIGLPQLAMHSSMETMGVKDFKAMEDLIKAFFN